MKIGLPTADKERKQMPIFTFLTEYFPDAILEMVKVSVNGNIQHNPELDPADIKWARGKSTNQLDTAFRHLWDHKRGIVLDTDNMYHLAKTAWRVLAQLQLQIEADRAAADAVPLDAPGALPIHDGPGMFPLDCAYCNGATMHSFDCPTIKVPAPKKQTLKQRLAFSTYMRR